MKCDAKTVILSVAVWISFRPKKNQQHLVLALEDTWTELLPVQIFEKRCPSNKRQAFFFKLWDSFIKDQFISSFSPHSLFWVLQYQPPHHHEKQPLPTLLTDPYVTFFFSNTPTKNNSSVYFTVQNWSKSPKKYPHFFHYLSLWEEEKNTRQMRRASQKT